MARRLSLWMCLLATCPSPAFAQRDATIPDPDPEVERRALEVAEGFEVNLFASETMLSPPDGEGKPTVGFAKPIQMNFDAEGRLWVASSEVYPQIKPGQVANDKILVLEDSDGDGKADKTTVFADGLLIPTGVAPGDGGAYVANSTELLHLKDTDGDGKADAKSVVLSGFGTEDTHHIIHTFQWGPDALFYFNQSIYIHSHVETPWGPRTLNGGGIWQFRPESRRLEVVMRGLVNSWGHAFDHWGAQFATDGAGGEGINYVVPGGSYVATPGASRIVAGLNPGSPKHCSLAVASGRHMPEDMQGVLVTNDFRANRVCRFRLSEDGSGFASREMPELIKTSFRAFRPVDVTMGPDGAIYIADWYNPIIQHGEVDFRDPRRDHTHGRIWRVTAKGRPLVKRPKLVDASVPELLERLSDPEDWTRLHAKLVLKGRGAQEVLPALDAWVAKIQGNDDEAEHRRLEALWLHQAFDVPEPGLLAALLRSPNPQARAAAVRVVPHWKGRAEGLVDLLAERVEDDHPRVRLEAVRALAAFDEPEAVVIAMRALDRPVDRFLDYALWLTARDLQPRWLPALASGTLDFGDDARKLTFALQAAGSPEVVGPLLDAIAGGSIAEARLPETFRLIGSLGTPEQVAQAAGRAASAPSRPVQAASLLTLADASAPRGLRPAGEANLSEILRGFIADTPADGSPAIPRRVAGLRAVAAWKVEGLAPVVRQRAEDDAEAEAVRIAAIEALSSLGGAENAGALDRLAKEAGPGTTRAAAVAALAAVDPAAAARRGVELLAGAAKGDEAARIFAAFTSRQGGPEALAAALADRSLPRDVAKVGVRAARGSGRPSEELVAALTKAGGLDASPPPPSPAEMEGLVADVASQGDPARGEALFRRADLQCLNCHAVAGAGGLVGPGLESIGASAQVDYLIDSILQPNKAVKEGYHSIVVATDDGRVLTGIVQLRTDEELVLRDADGREVRLATASVEAEKPGESLMPAGLTDALTRSELVDLVKFLSSLGRPGPYAVGPRRLVRRWEVLPATPEASRAVHRLGLDAAVAANDPALAWSPAYSAVSGALPLSDVPAVTGLPGTGSPSKRWARFALDVSTGGPVRLKLDPAEGITAWVDGRRAEAAGTMDLDLDPGRHVVTLAIDPSARSADSLAVELVDVPGSPAKVQAVLGK